MTEPRLTFRKKCGTCGGMCERNRLDCPTCRKWHAERKRERQPMVDAHAEAWRQVLKKWAEDLNQRPAG